MAWHDTTRHCIKSVILTRPLLWDRQNRVKGAMTRIASQNAQSRLVGLVSQNSQVGQPVQQD